MIFAYGAVTRYGLPFQGSWANQITYWCALSLAYAREHPYLITPACTSPVTTMINDNLSMIIYEHRRNTNGFELFPFRSPLLGECFLWLASQDFFSFPLRTEMFPFRRFASRACARDQPCLHGWGFPIRKSRDQWLLVASPKLIADMPRPSSPPGPKASTIRL